MVLLPDSPEAERRRLLKEMSEIQKELEGLGNGKYKDGTKLKDDIKELMEEMDDAGKDVDEIKEDVSEIKEDLDKMHLRQRNILKRLKKKITPAKFSFNDLAQQIVGAMILSVPLAVTEEVWTLSASLDLTRVFLIIGLTLSFNILLIYYTKYQAVKQENVLGFFPKRLLSIVFVSYTVAAFILFLFGVIGGQVQDTGSILKLVVFVGMFANIGASTADILK